MNREPYAPPPPAHIPSSRAKIAMAVLWPAFLAAAALNALVFSLIDPADLIIHGVPAEVEQLTAYAMGFATFFGFTTLSSFMTWSLVRPPKSEPLERRSPYSL